MLPLQVGDDTILHAVISDFDQLCSSRFNDCPSSTKTHTWYCRGIVSTWTGERIEKAPSTSMRESYISFVESVGNFSPNASHE